MNILLASAFPERILPILTGYNDLIMMQDESKPILTGDFVKENNLDLLICFGHGQMIESSALSATRAINLHGGLLPWNRGPNPNLWSWIDETPKGVTIHEIDSGVDTGAIIVQTEIDLDPKLHTLRTSFQAIISSLSALFAVSWPEIRSGRYIARPQPPGGSAHRLRDQLPLDPILGSSFDLPLCDAVALLKARLSDHPGIRP